MADGIHILLKRAKDYLDSSSPSGYKEIVSEYKLEYGEPIYLLNEKYLVIGDGIHTVRELINLHHYYSNVDSTVLYNIARYMKDIDIDASDRYEIANIGFTRDVINKLFDLFAESLDASCTPEKTLKSISYNKDTKKFSVEFQPIKIKMEQIEDYIIPESVEHAFTADKIKVEDANASSTTYYITGVSSGGGDYVNLYCANAYDQPATKANTNGIRFNGANGVLYGAAWNDFAEFRKCDGESGTVVCEVGDGSLAIATNRLQAGAAVISDTYGMVIGEENNYTKPIAVAGRVLVKYTGDINKYTAGAAVCAAPDGKIDIMTRAEIQEYPDRILGYISEIPNYDIWNTVSVNNRIWIKLK